MVSAVARKPQGSGLDYPHFTLYWVTLLGAHTSWGKETETYLVKIDCASARESEPNKRQTHEFY